MTKPETTICPHGSIKRKCDLCDAYEEIDLLNAKVKEQDEKFKVTIEPLKEIIADLVKRLEKAVDVLRLYPRDWDAFDKLARKTLEEIE